MMALLCIFYVLSVCVGIAIVLANPRSLRTTFTTTHERIVVVLLTVFFLPVLLLVMLTTHIYKIVK